MKTKRFYLRIAVFLACFLICFQAYIKPATATKIAFDATIPDIAARCKGEASFAVWECVCTVKERLENGWSPDRVLMHYYAPSVPVTPAEIKLAGAVLDGSLPCPDGMYYMFSASDVMSLGLSPSDATVIVENSGRRILVYPIDTFRGGRVREKEGNE